MVTAWIGPAIVAAFISALVTGIGWYVSDRQGLRRAAERRRERVVDFQTAILAEIRAGRPRVGDLAQHAASIDAALMADPHYTPFVPRQVPTFIMDALLADIHVLPTSVIDPIVVFHRQAAAISHLADDIRSDRFDRLDQDRKRAIYRDYVALLGYADTLADDAIEALSGSLNIQGAGRSALKSAGAPDEASGQNSSRHPLRSDVIGQPDDRGDPRE